MGKARAAVDPTAAREALGGWLEGSLGATQLATAATAPWLAKNFTHGWRLTLITTAQAQVTLDVLIDHRFPRSRPRIAWVDPPPFPSIPHVEQDGLICALNSSTPIDPCAPVEVAKTVLGIVAEIFEDGLAGRNGADFQTEFLSYWNPGATGVEIVSLIDPSGLSRIIRLWRSKKGLLAAESDDAIPRGGVYFEAGLAQGLNMPVIWAVREDQIGLVHFDTRQFNHITWNEPADLRVKVYRRVAAVLGHFGQDQSQRK